MPTEIVSLSEFKARAAQMRQRNALLMLKLMVQGEADIQAGRTASQDRVFAEVKARLATSTDG